MRKKAVTSEGPQCEGRAHSRLHYQLKAINPTRLSTLHCIAPPLKWPQVRAERLLPSSDPSPAPGGDPGPAPSAAGAEEQGEAPKEAAAVAGGEREAKRRRTAAAAAAACPTIITTRPAVDARGHTGYLTFARRLLDLSA